MKPQNPKYCIAILALILLLAITGCQPGSTEQAPNTSQPAVSSTPTGTFTGSVSFNDARGFEDDENDIFYSWEEEGLHWRNLAGFWIGDFSDDRLDGEYLIVTNWDSDKRATDKNWLWGNESGMWLGLGGPDGQSVMWDGVYTGATDENLIGHSEVTLHGVDPNKGLTAKMTCEIRYTVEPLSMSEINCQGAMYEGE